MADTEAKLTVGKTPESDQGISFRQDQLVRVGAQLQVLEAHGPQSSCLHPSPGRV